MSSILGKKIFLGLSITVPFLIYCIYYYGNMIKNAPFKFTEFESITLRYGIGDSLVNDYNSKTKVYHYLNSRDSLITTMVKLNKDDLLYLHRKAVQLGFWDYPEDLRADTNVRQPMAVTYYLEFRYKRKSKKLVFDEDYAGNPKLHDAAVALIGEVKKTINDAEDRQNAQKIK